MASVAFVTEYAVADGILLVAVVFQVSAAVIALAMLPTNKKHLAWVFLTAALIIQAWHRLYLVIDATPSPVHDAVMALAVSLFILASILALRSLIESSKKTTDELSLARAKAELYLDVSDAIIVVMDAEGRFMQVNQKGRAILDLEDEHIDIGEWFSTLPQPDMRSDLNTDFRTFMTGEHGEDMYLEYPIVTTRGRELYIFWHRHIVRDENGDVTGIISAGIDMTKRRAAERESEFRSQLLDKTSDAIIAVGVGAGPEDKDYGKIMYSNDAACVMAHRTHAQLNGTNVREFLRGDWLTALEKIQHQVRSTGSAIAQFDVEFGDAEPVPIEIHSHLIEAGSKKLVVSVLARRRDDPVHGLPRRAHRASQPSPVRRSSRDGDGSRQTLRRTTHSPVPRCG